MNTFEMRLRRGHVRSWPKPSSAHRQSGQVLVLMLFAVMVVFGALTLMFMGGQLTQEKTKLVNTADAVAYSGAVLQARALNFAAYSNRAMVANSVAMAQMASLASWLEYVKSLQSPAAANAAAKYQGFAQAYQSAMTEGLALYDSLEGNGRLLQTATASDLAVRDLLGQAQLTAYNSLLDSRGLVLNDVANANQPGGNVLVEETPMVDDFATFIAQYDTSTEARLDEVVRSIMSRDNFVKARDWQLQSPSACPGGAPDTLSRTGGTTMSIHNDFGANDALWEFGSAYTCDATGNCTCNGYNVQVASGSPGPAWTFTTAVPFLELSTNAQAAADPRMHLSLRVRRSAEEFRTPGKRSDIQLSPQLANFGDVYATQGTFVAVASAEVAFHRPAKRSLNDYFVALNEQPSLFNPYWQARLARDEAAITKARLDELAGAP